MGRLAAVLSNAERKEESLEGEFSIAWPMLVVRAAISTDRFTMRSGPARFSRA